MCPNLNTIKVQREKRANIRSSDKNNIFYIKICRFEIHIKILYRHLNLNDLIIIFISTKNLKDQSIFWTLGAVFFFLKIVEHT